MGAPVHRLLIDGAVVNPVLIAPTLGDATDLTIAVVEFSSPLSEGNERGDYKT